MGARGELQTFDIPMLRAMFERDPVEFMRVFVALTGKTKPPDIKPAYPEAPGGAIGERFRGLDLGGDEPVKPPTELGSAS